ncbi:Protein IQ-domain 1 [Apostasia shenzhenica]|uniref:Protein IQ-domain 1 n=1 Tax=Apostasia shenzhenica TaxID=1088818 RepID=A0A2I0ATR8_9ASPA|nr:Protein IQ-domain 1 [Apostasia shenzhenica]
MGSGDWFRTIIGRKKTKIDRLKQGSATDLSNGFKGKHLYDKSSIKLHNGSNGRSNAGDLKFTREEVAAIKIQSALRGYQARKIFCHLKGTQRLQVRSIAGSAARQTSNTLRYVQSWNKIQSEVRARRVCMVTEGRIKQKKQENQLKLEAKLYDLGVEWSGGFETMEEILSKIYQREEAAVKRERAMAYAFSHQWRANPGSNQGQSYEFGKGDWGWSWMERWIATRPWETRVSSSRRLQPKPAAKSVKKVNPSASPSPSTVKAPLPAVKVSAKKNSPQTAEQKAA